MTFRSNLLAYGVSCWLMAGAWVSRVEAQQQAMPPINLTERPPTSYGLSPRDVYPPSSWNHDASSIADVPRTVDMNVHLVGHESYGPFLGEPAAMEDCYTWQFLPNGVLFGPFLASGEESRFASRWVYDEDHGWYWDAVLGGHVGLLRYGTADEINPEGWQLDIEGAAFPRMDLEWGRDLVSADFRFGILLTARRGPWEAKFGYYHMSSHLGDELMVRVPAATRINYVRDALVLGVALWLQPDLRVYSEADFAYHIDGGARRWQFQFGVDYSSREPSGFWGAPFLAVNGRIREDVDYGGNLTAQAGWQWRGRMGQLTRIGVHYFNGKSDQRQFFNDHEEQIGLGLWYDY